jgi:2-aminomuconate deaminase
MNRPTDHLRSQKGPEPVGAYVHSRRVGDLLFLAGLGPRQRGQKEIPGVFLDPEGNVVGHDIEVQTEAVIQNVITILEESGSALDKIVDVQVFLTDMKADFAKFNRVYERYFDGIPATRTTVEVAALPTPIAVEFKVVATF